MGFILQVGGQPSIPLATYPGRPQTGNLRIDRAIRIVRTGQVAGTDERHIQEKVISVHGQDVKVVVSVKDQMYRFQIFAKRMYKYALLVDRSGLDEKDLVNEWLGVEKSLALYGQ